MLFNSLDFLVFFIVVTATYFTLPYKYRWFLLLAGSCYFYMAFIPVYILILGFTIVIDYFAGLFLESAQGKRRKIYLIASLIANVGVLAIFKYYNFFNNNFSALLNDFSLSNPIPNLAIILPIGLSFHTFQAMSYTIEVYRGKQKAERHFGIYALYVMFYPQLVAGPIERPQNLIHQFYEEHKFDYHRVKDGLLLMVWGLLKKVVIADRLAVVVDNVYNNSNDYSVISLIVATIFFSFQIFCDFSGYSDMAIGAAQVMGFKLMTNFNRPYQSKSISEFWKRWHISLSTWFKDYLYISLGGNRVSIPRWYFNLFIVFLISGFWHGANWTFIVWGALHGFYLVFGIVTTKIRKNLTDFIGLPKVPKIFHLVKVFITFVLVSFAWVFFRASSISEALYIIKNSIVGLPGDVNKILSHSFTLNLGITNYELFLCVLSIVCMEIIHVLQNKVGFRDFINKKPLYFRWAVYYLVSLVILYFGVYQDRQFIYFQF
ncbi:MAG: MBOAT family O-acyltransferase [bacterium]